MIDKTKLAERIRQIAGLTDDEKSSLLALLNEHKRYGLIWEEKEEEVEKQLQDELPVLLEVIDKRLPVVEGAPNHILIEGDNFHALTCLSYTHENAIDVIYIDPPYNTGNKDFVYNDSYVDSEDDFRHSKWLSFMAKRLRIARRLLSDNGVIFISIDDNEQAALQLLCDEVFGKDNFVGLMTLMSNPRGSQNSKFLSSVHEYVLMYANHINTLKVTGVAKEDESLNEFKEIDADGRRYRLLGLRKRGGEWRKEDRPNMYFPIYVNPENGDCTLEQDDQHSVVVVPKRPTGELSRWTWSREKFISERAVVIGKRVNRASEDDAWDIFRKDYIDDENGEEKTTKLKTMWVEKETNYQNARNELKAIFGNSEIFDYPKPTYIVQRLVSIIPNAKNILDFFAGSGTSLHAVMQLNQEDGGHRQCILVTNNENGICERITYERNKRVIQGYTNSKGEKVDGLSDNNLRYYRTDYVPRERTQRNMRALVNAATDMLCIQNDCYNERAFTIDGKKVRKDIARWFGDILIIYREEFAEEIAAEIARMDLGDKKLKVYIFSPGRYAFDDVFDEVQGKVELVALPAAIYDAYKRVLPKRNDKTFEEENKQDIPTTLF